MATYLMVSQRHSAQVDSYYTYYITVQIPAISSRPISDYHNHEQFCKFTLVLMNNDANDFYVFINKMFMFNSVWE
jgi:hypothetical protein